MLAVTFLAPFVYDALYQSPLATNVRGAFVVAYALVAVAVYLFSHFAGFSYRGTLIHTGVDVRHDHGLQRLVPDLARPAEDRPGGEGGDRPRRRPRRSWPASGPATTPTCRCPSSTPWSPSTRRSSREATGASATETWWIVFLAIIGLGWHVVFQLYKRSAKVQGFWPRSRKEHHGQARTRARSPAGRAEPEAQRPVRAIRPRPARRDGPDGEGRLRPRVATAPGHVQPAEGSRSRRTRSKRP